MKRYRIKSNEFASQCDLLKAAIHSYKIGDFKHAFTTAESIGLGPVPLQIVRSLLAEKIGWWISEDDVVFEAQEPEILL
ncbi:MAG: hypothetical protein PHT84_03920 [Candidatus Pacebacteria bacterium]|nr:hypothetical protein [Candidatus Paceibacterota bacterium]